MKLKYPYNLSDVYELASQKRFTVISTFSGGGGSSIGYKLAGGDVLLANEFVEVAAETYKLNFPDTPVLINDIKNLTGQDFLDAAGVKQYELDVLDGSPPCHPADTIINTNRGLIEIQSVEELDLVLTHLGRYRTVTGTTKTEYVGKMYRIHTNVKSSLECTPKHGLYIKRDNETGWVQCNELLLTDLLRNPITMEWLEIESISVFDFEGYVFNLHVDEDESYTANDIASHNCSAFSSVGKKEKGWNTEKSYSSGKKVKNIEDLFLEFIRITDEIKPKIVIAENVAGLQQGESRKKLNQFLNEFESIGYVTSFNTIDAQDFGVPQTRSRTIIIGVRQDVFDDSGEFFPNNFFPDSLRTMVSVREAFNGLEQTEEEIDLARNIVNDGTVIRKVMKSFPVDNDTDKIMNNDFADPGLTKNGSNFFSMKKLSWNRPRPCLTATISGSGNIHPGENRKLTTKESYRIMALPDDYKNAGTYNQQLERVGRMHSPFPLAHVVNHIVKEYLGK